MMKPWMAAALPCLLLATAAPAAPPLASAATLEANRRFAEGLAWADREDESLAARGFVATRADPKIRAADGRVVLDLSAYDGITGDAPPTANPSLWRHAGLLKRHGLFKVAPRIWQVRGFDISVMSVIEGERGFIIVDPLTTTEVAAAALALVREHVGNRPVSAVIYTHSHADHFGGVRGVVDEADVRAGRVPIVAPDGFLEHAVSENLIAGPAMSRRAIYQFGRGLAPGNTGHLGAGIGMEVSRGTISLIAPTRSIMKTGEALVLDGVRFEFQLTPNTEAPAEMNFFLPELGALCLAENANVTLHNILPARGALVRDAKAWADALSDALTLYGDMTEVLFVSHGWPRWGRDEIARYVSSHRDAYKYLHDQSVRLMNQGLTAPEIAETLELPPVIARQWFNRGYYGTLRHNARAVYQRYLGWYDANPANLDGWPPEEAGKRYVAAMGGRAKALKVAERAYAAGDYRWAAEVASRLTFADGKDLEARELLARSFEQLGFQAEGMLWRNMYLTGAREARTIPTAAEATTVALDLIAATTTPQLFDLLAIRVDPALAAGRDLAVDFVFPDRAERTRVTLRNSVLVHAAEGKGEAQATVTLPRPAFLSLLFAGAEPAALVSSGVMKVEGDPAAVRALLQSLDRASPRPPFPIVTP
jgi:alkyl sulfatase BDS1-like metallo-beta-lactamase superfamily hydrolase